MLSYMFLFEIVRIRALASVQSFQLLNFGHADTKVKLSLVDIVSWKNVANGNRRTCRQCIFHNYVNVLTSVHVAITALKFRVLQLKIYSL